jgi:hypothetical protein
MRRKEKTVLGVGCRERDVGSVVCGVGQLRSQKESRESVDGMMIWRSDKAVELASGKGRYTDGRQRV